ncbi:DUF748 domain-containing protein [Vibrio algivorus]|uniref:DUF748 domain-containing protein n=1 Tax=Vibrio algivorus TaxID=1667024 RepID=A0A557NYB2_9VIBR|nr:DUF748 domain-containing protein [Vibrio algivorus]TVO33325.1 DUF748 domain-containing protein [Vibrio algivorus]
MLSFVKTACSRFKQAPRSIRITSYLGIAYTTYALILGLVVPAVAQSKVPTTLSELLGRQVIIEKVRINPFLLRFRVDGFEIKEADDSQSFVSFERLDLQIGFWRSVLHLTPSLDHLYLQQPNVNMVRVDNLGNFNFTDIIDSVAQASKPTEETKDTDKSSTSLPPIHARDIQLTNGQFDFIDNPTGAHLKYQGLNIRLPQLDSQAETIVKSNESQSTDSSQENHFAINVTGADNGSLDLEGKFQFEPFAIEGKLGMNNITLSNFWPFAEKQLDAKLTNGKFNFSTEFQAKNEPTRFDYSTSNGRFELLDLHFTDGEKDRIKLPRLTLDAIALTNKEHTVDIGSLTFDGLWIDALFDKQGLDLQRLFTPKQEAPKPTVSVKAADTERNEPEEVVQPSVTVTKQPNQNDTGWIVRLHKFAMINNDININEKMVSNGVHWRINPFNIEASNIISDLSQPIDYKINLEVNSWIKSPLDHTRGSFASQGKINAKDLTFNGDINLDQLELSQFQAYIDPYLNARLQDGKLSTKGQFSADTQGHANYAGKANITSLLVRDKLEYQPLIKWSNMAVNNLYFDLAQKSIKINSINVKSLYSKVLIDKQQRTNIGSLVKPQPASTSQSKSSTPNSKPYSVDVGSINISNGSAYFADYSLTPSFASGIESLNGSIKHLSSTPGTKASVDLNGKINKYAPVTLKGDINPLIKNPYLDLDLIFKSVELTSVNPYSGTYAGYYIDKGQLSLDLKYQLENNHLIGENHMVIDQLKLGEPSNSDLATSLPLSLAIALLQDRNGVIDLGVQVTGDVNNPDFSFGSVIWGAFANVITKAVTSPFSMIAGLAGSDEELNHILFDAGKATITEEQQGKLDIVAKALQERPKLQLSIVASVQEAEDTRAIAEQKLQTLLLKESGDDAIPENLTADNFPADSDLSDALEDLFKAQFNIRIGTEEDKVEEQLKAETNQQDIDDDVLEQALNASMYNQLVDAQEVNHDELGSLAVERARAIKAYLVDVQQIEPARVFILDSKTKLKTEDRSAELSLDGS